MCGRMTRNVIATGLESIVLYRRYDDHVMTFTDGPNLGRVRRN